MAEVPVAPRAREGDTIADRHTPLPLHLMEPIRGMDGKELIGNRQVNSLFDIFKVDDPNEKKVNISDAEWDVIMAAGPLRPLPPEPPPRLVEGPHPEPPRLTGDRIPEGTFDTVHELTVTEEEANRLDAIQALVLAKDEGRGLSGQDYEDIKRMQVETLSNYLDAHSEELEDLLQLYGGSMDDLKRNFILDSRLSDGSICDFLQEIHTIVEGLREGERKNQLCAKLSTFKDYAENLLMQQIFYADEIKQMTRRQLRDKGFRVEPRGLLLGLNEDQIPDEQVQTSGYNTAISVKKENFDIDTYRLYNDFGINIQVTLKPEFRSQYIDRVTKPEAIFDALNEIRIAHYTSPDKAQFKTTYLEEFKRLQKRGLETWFQTVRPDLERNLSMKGLEESVLHTIKDKLNAINNNGQYSHTDAIELAQLLWDNNVRGSDFYNLANLMSGMVGGNIAGLHMLGKTKDDLRYSIDPWTTGLSEEEQRNIPDDAVITEVTFGYRPSGYNLEEVLAIPAKVKFDIPGEDHDNGEGGGGGGEPEPGPGPEEGKPPVAVAEEPSEEKPPLFRIGDKLPVQEVPPASEPMTDKEKAEIINQLQEPHRELIDKLKQRVDKMTEADIAHQVPETTTSSESFDQLAEQLVQVRNQIQEILNGDSSEKDTEFYSLNEQYISLQKRMVEIWLTEVEGLIRSVGEMHHDDPETFIRLIKDRIHSNRLPEILHMIFDIEREMSVTRNNKDNLAQFTKELRKAAETIDGGKVHSPKDLSGKSKTYLDQHNIQYIDITQGNYVGEPKVLDVFNTGFMPSHDLVQPIKPRIRFGPVSGTYFSQN